ncbi:MAG: flagellar biosynthetic protein FliO [Alphaproteobacteria bacterium]|nr:flagellar biosynthetic protein FliO [Alphaproteobacteria bacterium]
MPDLPPNIMNIIVAALVVLAVLIVVLLVWRALSPRMSGRRGQRLGISEYHELDKTRRLVLVRRDNVEHLLLIGGPQDVVVEAGIQVPGTPAAYVPQSPSASPQPVTRPAPRAPIFGDRRPSPVRPAEASDPPLTSPSGRDPD